MVETATLGTVVAQAALSATAVAEAPVAEAPSGQDFEAPGIAPLSRRARAAERKRQAILTAALDLFSTLGVDGTSLDRVAERADVSKTNLIYYYPSKNALYEAVLTGVLRDWLDPLAELNPTDPPDQAIRRYIRRKIAFSRDNPAASRLFCFEMLQGAPILRGALQTLLRPMMDAKAGVIRQWIAAGAMAATDPHQLIFSLWATTQHFADFAPQIEALCDTTLDDPAFFERSVDHVTQLFLSRIRPPEAT
jgi:TetR/AcrR family transcriptional regulator